MRRAGLPMLGGALAVLLLSLAGLGLGEVGVIGGIFGTALGAVLCMAGGAPAGGDGEGDGGPDDGGDGE